MPSSQNASSPGRERCFTSSGGAVTPCFDKLQYKVVEEVPHKSSRMVNGSALNSPSRDSNRGTSSKKGGEEHMTQRDRNGDARSSSKKRKRMDSRTYLKKFKPIIRPNAEVSHDKVGMENTSNMHVADSNVAMPCEGGKLVEETNEHSSNSVCNVSRSPTSGLHETSETRVGQCTAPFSEVKQSPSPKLQKLPDMCHPYFDNDHLCSINQLREFWYKSHGAVVVDDKEHVTNTILFTMSVLPDVCQPFLIVTTPACLSLWEAQFNKFAPFINVVVYDGGKDKLKIIQDLEFYENGRCIMLQVLLSHPDAILEGIEPIACIGWEAVIVDYYQKTALKHLEKLRQLSADFRVLLLSSPIQDNLLEYMKLLDFLNSTEQENNNNVDSADALAMLKIRFARHIVYERQADSSKNLEHWVPAYISQLQLENYCSILLLSSSILQLQMTTDCGRGLREIIMSLSKCCDHPYLIEEFLQNSPVNNHDQTESVDTRVHACGKLLLLDKMLKEIHNKSLRVIVLFQSSGAGGNPLGDILEGVVRHRFGPDSYERVEFCAPLLRKQDAVSNFNDKTKGRFVFLIELRACLPSIELSSVDAIIMYNSDWNPLNDLKSLQRMKIESQLYPSIFRLYTPFTVEEKKLVLAKQGMPFDNNIQDIFCSLSHSLISWGASFLFTKLDKLQQDNYASKSSKKDTRFIDKIISEFLTKLPTSVEDNDIISSAAISEANINGRFYSRSITLIGEKEGMPTLDGDPSKFWLNLLDGRSPCCSYISEPPQSSHRMLQNMEDPAKVPAEETDKAKTDHTKVGKIPGPSSKIHDDTFPENCSTVSPPLQPGVKKLMMGTPKGLSVQLKQELSKLIKVLQLPDNVSLMIKQFCEYILKNHLAVLEPTCMLHALNIALCWLAASHLNYKVDRMKLLAQAKKCLNYECTEELAELFYAKLRILREKFPDRAGETSNKCQPASVDDTEVSSQEICTNLRNGHLFQKKEIYLHGNLKNGAPQEVSSCAEHISTEGEELITVEETHREFHLSKNELLNLSVEKRIDLIDHIFSLREKCILDKQKLEISDLETHRHNKVIRLKEVCNLVLEHIRRSHIDEITRNDKTKLIIQWFTILMYAYLEHVRLQHNKLEALQSNTLFEERRLKEKLHQEAKSGQLDETLDRHITLPDSKFVMEDFIHSKEQNDEYHIVDSSVSDCQQPSNDRLLVQITLVQNAVPSEPISLQRVQNEPVGVLVGSGRGPASEALGIPETSTNCNSACISLQNVGSSSIIPTDDSIGQESSTSASSMFSQQGTDPSGQQMLAPPCHPLTESEQTGLLCTQVIQDLQLEMQPAILLIHPGDSRQTCCQTDRGTGLLQAGVATSNHLGDARTEVETDDDGSVDGYPVHSDSPAYIAHNPATLLPCTGVETQTCQSDFMTVEQIRSLPAPQSLAIGRHLPAEAETGGILGTETSWDLQPEVQPLTLMQDQHLPGEAELTGILSTEVAWDLQLEVQQSTSMQDQYLTAEAEPAGILGMDAARDLQPEVQPSSSRQDQAEQLGVLSAVEGRHLQPEMLPSISRQNELVLQSPTIHQSGEPLLDRHGVESAGTSGMVAIKDVQPEIQSAASLQAAHAEAEGPGILGTVPSRDLQSEVQPSTSLQDQHMHAEAEPTSILGVEGAQDLQPNVQPSTSLQDQEERASVFGTITTWPLQLETQTSASTQDGQLVLQSQTIHQSMEPSFNPHRLGTSDMVTAHNLQSEIQRSALMHDPPAEAGPGILRTTAAQDLQPEMQSSATVDHAPLERTNSEESTQIGFQPNMARSPEQPTQLTPPTMFVFNHPMLSEEPLKNELNKLKHLNNFLSKAHEQKISLLLIEYNQEAEKIKRKYDSLLQKEYSTYIRRKEVLVDIYKKVFVHQSLAENFRKIFTPSSAAQARSKRPVMERQLQSSSVVQTATSRADSSSAIRSVSNSFHLTGPYNALSTVAQPSSSSSRTVQLQPILPDHLHGATSSPFVSASVPHDSYRFAGARSHTVQPQSDMYGDVYRASSPYHAIYTNQQRRHVSPQGQFASTGPHTWYVNNLE